MYSFLSLVTSLALLEFLLYLHENLGLYVCLVLPLKRTTVEWLKRLAPPTSVKTSVKVLGLVYCGSYFELMIDVQLGQIFQARTFQGHEHDHLQWELLEGKVIIGPRFVEVGDNLTHVPERKVLQFWRAFNESAFQGTRPRGAGQ